MNKEYLSAFEKTLGHEGGYNEVKGDAGGATNFGVSLRFLKDAYNFDDTADIDNDGDVDKDDIKSMSKADAQEIYYKHFWLKNKCDQITNQIIASKFFDMSVNMGLVQATKLLQRSLNHFKLFNIAEDGKIGPKTLQAVNQVHSDQLLHVMRKECEAFYIRLVEKKPEYKKFLKGWTNRALS
jgi:lysozyme family protein